MNGFFPSSDIQSNKPVAMTVARCGQCNLYQHCRSKKMPPSGQGKKKILLIGEAPGPDEDLQGRQFAGVTGRLLQTSLSRCGVDMRSDCWLTNALACFPKTTWGKYRTPKSKEIEYCRPKVIEAIKKYQPEVIIPLGAAAAQSVFGWLWKPNPGKISRWTGWQIPCQALNCWICPTFHPSYVSRKEEKGRNNEVIELVFEKHLEAACQLSGRPWDKKPDWKRDVCVLINPDKAADAVKYITSAGLPAAVDIETDRLKPDREDATIISCSMSNGLHTISFPWIGKSVKATKEFLLSDVPKIGYNSSFESRWFKEKLGVDIRNWVWDGMIAAHLLDNRPNICSLKFQAFVLLGQPLWNESVSPFFNSPGSNEPNRIKQIGLNKLLLYGGLDSLLEFKVAQIQSKQLGMTL